MIGFQTNISGFLGNKFDVRNRIKHFMNYGIFDHLCGAPNPSLGIASIMVCINYNWCSRIWVSVQSLWRNSICTSESNIAANYWPDSNTNGIWSANDAKLGVKLGIWYQRIGCKVFNHPASQIGAGWVGPPVLAKVSDQNCQKSQVAHGGRGWQMMYNEKFCRYCQQPQGPTNTFLVQISKDSRGN